MRDITTNVYLYDELTERAQEQARDWYRLLQQDKYQLSDEDVEEKIRCNEYEFTEDGKRA